MAESSEERRREVEERAARNGPVIEEFRATKGKLSGPMGTMNVLLLHHTGTRSGTERVNPLAYRPVGENFAIFASNAGRTANPDWYYNLVAHPETVIEVGAETIPVRARVLPSEERAPIWEAQKADAPTFADYERSAPREIPVVLLERI